MFEGYSSAGITTLSPSRQGNPSAMSPMPWVVELTKAISSRSAFKRLAMRSRMASTLSAQAGQLTTPFSSCSSVQVRKASPDLRGRGATAAWSR